MRPHEIRSLRKRLGLSVDKFAEKLAFVGKHRATTIYRFETGQRTPSPQTIVLMKQLEKSK